MSIRDASVTGHASGEFPVLRRKIRRYLNRGYSLKIGITSNPEGRWRKHSSEYDRMVLLYKTKSRNYVTAMESDLIDAFWDYCDNSIGGGGGSDGGPPYWVYVVLA